MEREILPLAQRQQAGGLVDLGAGQKHRADRRVAQALLGMQRGVARICARRSGDALQSSQFSPSADTAIPAWLRGSTRGSPAHAKAQTGQ